MKIKVEIETGWAQVASTLDLVEGTPRTEAIAFLSSLLDACSIQDDADADP